MRHLAAVGEVWHCNGLANQQWQVWNNGTIRHDGLCLDAKNYGIANGTKLQLWSCTGGANQKWDTKSWRIHYDNPAAVNKVLDDTGHRHQLGDYMRTALSLGLQARGCEEPTATGTGSPPPGRQRRSATGGTDRGRLWPTFRRLGGPRAVDPR
jgi:hypothetical protein